MVDLTPFVPVATALVAAIATLGGVWITQAHTANREKQARAEARADRDHLDLRASAREVLDLFVAEGIYLEEMESAPLELRDFDRKYEAHLYGGVLQRIGMAIALVPDVQARNYLTTVLRAVTDCQRSAGIYGYPSWPLAAGSLLSLAAELCSAYARGEEPDERTMIRYRKVEASSRDLSAAIAEAYERAMKDLARQGSARRADEGS